MTLRTKFFVTVFPIFIAGVALALMLAWRAVGSALVDSLGESALTEVEAQLPALTAAVEHGGEGTLLALLQRLSSKLGAAEASVLDGAGAVLADTDVVARGRVLADAQARADLARSSRSFRVGPDDRTLDIVAPILAADDDFLVAHEAGGQRRIATLRLRLPLSGVRATQRRILASLVLILALAAGSVFAATHLVIGRFLRPIGAMRRAFGEVGRGHRGVHVQASSRDELGELAAAFNRMSADLASTTISRDYFDGLFRDIADAVVVVGEDCRVQEANRAAFELLGHPETGVIGRPFRDFIAEGLPPRDDEHYFSGDEMAALRREGILRGVEMRLAGKGGAAVPVLVSASVLRSTEGEQEGIVLIAKDLSERRRLEAMLLQAEKLSAVGQLAAGVAHEINNPLGIILGFAQSAARRVPASDPLSLAVTSIEREAVRCKNLVQDLLTFSRQNKGRMEPLDLNEAVRASLSLVEARAKLRSVEVVLELADAALVSGDWNQLQQVVVNLCNNAIDAMESGGRLTIRTRAGRAGAGAAAVLEVADTGAGIPEEIRGDIFNPFFTTKGVGRGTGLGLSLVYEIVQRHQGAVDVQSAVGKGSTFTVTLPASSPGAS